jgi:glycosyltransferase involved in cell wall biosynthesis
VLHDRRKEDRRSVDQGVFLPLERRRGDRRRDPSRAWQAEASGPGAAPLTDEWRLFHSAGSSSRPRASGKFLFAGDEKLWVRGVTYGTFRPDAQGNEFHDPSRVEQDFRAMAAAGVNAVRTYTVPPRWLLDVARCHGLRVMVGLPWEQHIAFLDNEARTRSIEERVRTGVRACAGHPAVLCYAVGNEIPGPIVRWHGRRRIEGFIRRLFRAAKAEDPDGLVTYVNYPTTEYLELTFLDLACFNVYLESQDRLAAYLARLHNLVRDKPLLMAEIGLDSRRHGEGTQARVLDWQVRTAFSTGCAGAFVFAWTDEWHRGGYDIEDWDFGLIDRRRRPKPALAAVSEAFGEIPAPKSWPWPRVSVVVCTFNGARTIRDCCEGLLRLDYPNFEVIVVDDGSRDETAAIAHEYGFRVITTENRGLSSARNTGLAAATGEIVAYIDDDAYPDPHWLRYLAATFLHAEFVGVGGPNIPPAGDGPIAECVANAPGGPIHVLVTDTEAEHLPGCNMAFRKSALDAIGGFDARFRTAGDDVDVCWRLQDRGGKLGFNPAAVVWHHRRNSVRAYWRQQVGYGRAEALLEQKWPEKYNGWGHLTWLGRLYGRGLAARPLARRGRIYHGTWGTAPFQALYQPSAPSGLAALALMPEWFLIIAGLAGLAVLGTLWAPLLWALPLLGIAVTLPVVQAATAAVRCEAHNPGRPWRSRARFRALTALLHLAQPLARLTGRVRHGLTPWRQRGGRGLRVPWPRSFVAWRETWRGPAETLEAVEEALRAGGAVVRRGGDFDPWDLEVRGGVFGGSRVTMVIEEHGAGRQLVRFGCRPFPSTPSPILAGLIASLAALAAADHALVAAGTLTATFVATVAQMLWQCGRAMAAISRALSGLGASER